MTTNIFDGNAKVMACDSRWSVECGDWLFYLDDTGYSKIERCNGYSLMFAGHGDKIQQYKNWIRSEPKDSSCMPDVKGMSVCMVEDKTGLVEFAKHQDIISNNVMCAGSGARWAFGCWTSNKCSKTAVETAKSKDYYSGGDVKFINFSTSETNVNNYNAESQLTIDVVAQNITQRGAIMKIQANNPYAPNLPFPKADNAANDEATIREEASKLVAAGKLSATAPCDGMHNEWTESDKSDFKAALGKMFNWKNQVA